MKSLKQVSSRISWNIVVTQTTAIFHLLLVKDKTFLIQMDSFFVLDFCFLHLNGVCRFHFQKKDHLFQRMFLERFACHYKVLQPSEESISLNIVVTQAMTIFHLFSVKDKTLVIWRDSFFALNFSFHHLNGVCRLYFLSGRLFSQCSYKDLHATTNS